MQVRECDRPVRDCSAGEFPAAVLWKKQLQCQVVRTMGKEPGSGIDASRPIIPTEPHSDQIGVGTVCEGEERWGP